MERQEDLLLPGLLNPYYSLSHAFPSHDKLIGSLNPCYDGGLVGEALLSAFPILLQEVRRHEQGIFSLFSGNRHFEGQV